MNPYSNPKTHTGNGNADQSDAKTNNLILVIDGDPNISVELKEYLTDRGFDVGTAGKSGANAVEYGLIMALVSVFIIAGIVVMSGALGALFNAMGQCFSGPAACTAALF